MLLFGLYRPRADAAGTTPALPLLVAGCMYALIVYVMAAQPVPVRVKCAMQAPLRRAATVPTRSVAPAGSQQRCSARCVCVDAPGTRNKLRDAELPRSGKSDKGKYDKGDQKERDAKDKDAERGGDRQAHTGEKEKGASTLSKGSKEAGSKAMVRSSSATKKETEGSVKEQKESRPEKERESNRSGRSARGTGDAPPSGLSRLLRCTCVSTSVSARIVVTFTAISLVRESLLLCMR